MDVFAENETSAGHNLVAGWQHNVRFIPVFTWDTVTCWLLVGNTMYVLYLYSRGILLHVGC